MEKYGFVPEILLLVALLSAGTILFLVIRKVIEQMGIFRGRRAGIAAFSISCLIVASIAMLLLVPGNAGGNAESRFRVNFSFLPGVAVAGTIILLQLFMIAGATTIKTDDVPVGESAHKLARPKSPGRPRKEEPGRPPTLPKSGGKGKSEAKKNTGAEGAATT